MAITQLDIGQGKLLEYHTQVLTFFDTKKVFKELLKLDWRHEGGGTVPRKEYFTSEDHSPYTYGKGVTRTYEPQFKTQVLDGVQKYVEAILQTKFDFCFLNYYRDGKDHLGWHADDSPEIDDAKPIAVLSLGAEREIWIRENGAEDSFKIPLNDDSLLIMPPGMQDTHQHRIPKSSRHNCGPRISLTYRGKAR